MKKYKNKILLKIFLLIGFFIMKLEIYLMHFFYLFKQTNPEGVAKIIFSEPSEAEACIKLLNGRWFGKRKITAELWDGKTKYQLVTYYFT